MNEPKLVTDWEKMCGDRDKEYKILEEEYALLGWKIADLEKELSDLKNGVCEHVAQNVLAPDCRICELSLKEKRLEIVEKENKKLLKKLVEKGSKKLKLREINDNMFIPDPVIEGLRILSQNQIKLAQAIADAEKGE